MFVRPVVLGFCDYLCVILFYEYPLFAVAAAGMGGNFRVVNRRDIDELRDAMLGFDRNLKAPTLEDMRKKKEKEMNAELLQIEESPSEEEKERIERLRMAAEVRRKEEKRLLGEFRKLGLVNDDEKELEEVKDSSTKRRLEQAK
ncbi:unnamed protein product [Gongylonema pulchrum]|uniref:Complexin-2 n=1 Tax=Gongylonema pulchrum TaxID=637853 RepID=A0A183DXV9_9BILA|nr:unnamed protein product [Gongylonema pulchrum]